MSTKPQQTDIVTEARKLLRQIPATQYFVPEKDAAEHNYQLILTMGFTAGVIGRIQVTPFTVGYVPIAQAFARAPELLRQLADEVERLREEWNTRFNTLCGLCGKRYLGPRDEHLHGFGRCDKKAGHDNSY